MVVWGTDSVAGSWQGIQRTEECLEKRENEGGRRWKKGRGVGPAVGT
jgi:hypothetical protein